MSETERCPKCDEEAEQINVGFVPLEILDDSNSYEWVDLNVCPACEGAYPKQYGDEELKEGEDEYIAALEDAGIIDPDEADSIRQMD